MSWVKKGDRLVLYGQKAEPVFWSEEWQDITIEEAVIKHASIMVDEVVNDFANLDRDESGA